jgi:hypothetical protein
VWENDLAYCCTIHIGQYDTMHNNIILTNGYVCFVLTICNIPIGQLGNIICVVICIVQQYHIDQWVCCI